MYAQTHASLQLLLSITLWLLKKRWVGTIEAHSLLNLPAYLQLLVVVLFIAFYKFKLLFGVMKDFLEVRATISELSDFCLSWNDFISNG
jgi:hypothetical protein